MNVPRVTIRETPLSGARIIEAPRFRDDRGWFAELWNAETYRTAGLDISFVQDNVSYSTRGVLRGLHFQWPQPQGKLVSVLRGSIFDVIVDARVGSPTFGRWFGSELSAENGRQMWAPEGFAHGFLVLSDDAFVHYNCTAPYAPACDRALAWNDPDVAIEWPLPPGNVSAKDAAAPRLHQLHAQGALPAWPG